MTTTGMPYPMPRKLPPDLDRVRAYWEGLKRGEANMPFWDDVNLSHLPDLAGRVMLIEVFEKPMRFRFGSIGDEIKRCAGADYTGKFLDEFEARARLEYLSSQCDATVESRAPTYYRHSPRKDGTEAAPEGYARLILPMWGDGRIGMLLAAVAWD
jgi:hypothetical protein